VQTSKELTKSFFAGTHVSRIPFIPLICIFAARLEQISVQNMLSSPDLLTKALVNAYKLYGYDGMINVFDPTLEAEACGCSIVWEGENSTPLIKNHPLSDIKNISEIDISTLERKGRFPVCLEATKRLKILIGREVAIIGVLTGPVTLASYLSGREIVMEIESEFERVAEILDFTSKVVLKICRTYCELNVDGIMVADEMLAKVTPVLLSKVSRYFKPIWNMTRFYNCFSIIWTRDCYDIFQCQNIMGLGADGAILGCYTPILQSGQGKCLGLAIPISVLCGKKEEIEEKISELLKSKPMGSFFLTTENDIPFDAPIDHIFQLVHNAKLKCSTQYDTSK